MTAARSGQSGSFPTASWINQSNSTDEKDASELLPSNGNTAL